MQGISQGTTLAGRYTLTRALAHQANCEQWLADDTTLDREVTVICFPADGPHTEAALDSARRAAGVEDHHLLRVLDVGTHDTASFVVAETLHGAESVAAILQFDTIPAEEARRLIGESASGLNTAASRGLHHLQLDPHDIMRSRDGSVSVLGVATDAALAGLDDVPSDEASRTDAVALVRVLYAALTGEWPGDDEVPGLVRVKRRADGVLPSPSELVTGVPGDLDTLCRTTLNGDEGPRTPGELARQLSPWSSERVHGAGGRPHLPGEDHHDTGFSASAPAAGVALPGAPTPGTGGDAPYDDWSAYDTDETMIGRRPEFDADQTAMFSVPGERRSPAAQRPHHEVDDLEPPVPLLQTGTSDPDHPTSRLALAIVAIFVVLAVLLGAVGLRNIFQGSDSSSSGATAQSTLPPASSTPSGPSSSKTTKKTTTSNKPIAVKGISSFDPEGNQDEHNELAQRAIDGDPSTFWETHIYASNVFGGLKSGTGLILDLGSEQKVGKVEVDIAGSSPTTMSVYVTKQATIRDQQPIGKIAGKSGKQTVGKKLPVTGRYVIVWITSLSQIGTGQYRDVINEVKVRS